MENKIYDAFNAIKAEDSLKKDIYFSIQDRINRKKKTVFKRFSIVFASVIFVFFAGLMSYNLYFTEVTFMDIDVNPSFELTLNRFNRVIAVYAYNDDGKEVLNNINIKNKSYKDALKILIDKMEEMSYIKDSSLFTATLQMNDSKNEKGLLDSMKVYLDSILQYQNKQVEQDIFTVDSETKTHSHEQNLTPAKYLSILELQTVEPEVTFDSCRNHTISEIKQQTHEHMNSGHENSENHEEDSDSQKQSSSGSNNNNNNSDSHHGNISSGHGHGNKHN